MNNENQRFNQLKPIFRDSKIEGLKWIPSLGILEDEKD